MIRFFNTLGRKVEEFKPIKAPYVKLYTCGPTVYDYYHLGNLRSLVFEDTLRRVLEFNGYDVRHVMNITDVGHLVSDTDEGEDKLEKGAQREHKTVWQVAQYYTEAFKNDAESLNILPPNGYPSSDGPYAKASSFIKEQIDFIRALLDKGYAYQTHQAIYFDISKLDDYGILSGQKLQDKEVGSRSEIVTDKNKRQPQDFALWFFRVGRFANHEMRWPSPWGEGFPGWHIECSAIIHATLGDPIDIHTGGVDHIGTHHANEMAQTEGAYGNKLAHYWLHNEFLLVDGQKMAKSLDNFYTIKDIKEKDYSPLALRLLFLQSHYRSQQNFTWAALDSAQKLLNHWYAWADRIFQLPDKANDNQPKIDQLIEKVRKRINDDLKTPEAIAEVSKFIDVGNPKHDLLRQLDNIFGLDLSNRTDINHQQKMIIKERETAREENDWSQADKLRSNLESEGIGLEDTPYGPIWYKLENTEEKK